MRRACVATLLLAPMLALPVRSLDAQATVSPSLAMDAARIANTRRAPFAAFSMSAQGLRDSLVALARAQVGRRYRLGGTTPDRGFDCSGLVKYVMNAFGTEVPRTAREQARRGEAVERDTSRLRPGDLLTFGSGKRIEHIGIYVGDGRFVHASSVAGRVIESPVNRPPARRIKPWRGVRRVLTPADSATMLPAAAAAASITAATIHPVGG
jgi:cell wall-associated NlpC family hydrolase